MQSLLNGQNLIIILERWGPGLYSLSGRTSYRKISWSLEAARLVVGISASLRNLTGASAAQQCCRCACQISKRSDNLRYKSRGLETLWDLIIRRLIGCRNRALGPFPFMAEQDLSQSEKILRCNVFSLWLNTLLHDDVIKWKHFPHYLPFVRGIHRSPVNVPHKGQWRKALMFSLICDRRNGWVNNRDADDLRRHHAHYDVIMMSAIDRAWTQYYYCDFELEPDFQPMRVHLLLESCKLSHTWDTDRSRY